MKTKKIIISIVALLAILAAVLSVLQWQKKAIDQPVRQEREIR